MIYGICGTCVFLVTASNFGYTVSIAICQRLIVVHDVWNRKRITRDIGQMMSVTILKVDLYVRLIEIVVGR